MKFSLNVPPMGPASRVPPALRGLHDFLSGRYADTVVLSFSEIEDLNGGPLPELASRPEWWITATDGSASSQSSTWTEANRSAVPHVIARKVVFERLADR